MWDTNGKPQKSIPKELQLSIHNFSESESMLIFNYSYYLIVILQALIASIRTQGGI